MLPRGHVRRDFIARCEVSPALCSRLWYGVCGFAVASASPSARCAPLPRPPGGAFVWAPLPLRWLPAGARRMPLCDSAEPVQRLFWWPSQLVPPFQGRLSRRCGAPMLGERVGLILLIVADHSTTVVVDPAAAETHLTTSRRQWPAANRAALDLSVRSPKSVCFLARRHSADLCGSRTCEAAQQAQN